ncbi:MAG: hypothetical protein KME46_33590 [Brasilonema angustatum HA4187-MV1]|nr:hypothetical protein [Brasilonema angustatum HA4187-MV1]
MLSIYQSEKVAIAQKLLQEVKCEVKEKDLSKEILLGDAIATIEEIIQQDLPEGYIIPKPKVEAWEYRPTTGDRILEILSWIAGLSLLSSALSACLSLGAFGISEFKIASGLKDNNNYAAECRGYRGLSFTFLAIALTGGMLGSVVGDAVNKGDK